MSPLIREGRLLWLRNFETIEDPRLALPRWAEPYTEQWLIERQGFRSPAQGGRDHYAKIQPLTA